jgi:YfiH family protein
MPSPVILKKHDGFYSIPLLETFDLKAAFTTRKYDMGFEPSDGGRIGFSRKQAYKKIGISSGRLICPSQVHNDSVVIVDEAHRGRGAFERSTALKATDAVITDKCCLPLAILTADCLPVFIFDCKKKVIAMAHAGWRGVHKEIILKTILKMKQKFLSEPAGLIIVLGPCIRRCCYEVGKDFLKIFKNNIFHRGAKYYFDLAGSAINQAMQAGVIDSHIYDTRICTSCRNDEFFSYRREGFAAGRSMSVIEIL